MRIEVKWSAFQKSRVIFMLCCKILIVKNCINRIVLNQRFIRRVWDNIILYLSRRGISCLGSQEDRNSLNQRIILLLLLSIHPREHWNTRIRTYVHPRAHAHSDAPCEHPSTWTKMPKTETIHFSIDCNISWCIMMWFWYLKNTLCLYTCAW